MIYSLEKSNKYIIINEINEIPHYTPHCVFPPPGQRSPSDAMIPVGRSHNLRAQHLPRFYDIL